MGKGGDNERKSCRYLSLWWSDGKDPDIFWRNRTRITTKGKGKYQLGDVVALKAVGDPLVQVFNIELKTGYSVSKKKKGFRNVPWDLLELVDFQGTKEDLSKKQIIIFWEQASRDAKISERIPLLIFKRDYHREVVGITDQDLYLLEDENGPFKESNLVFVPKEKERSVLIFIRMEEFFNWLSPETVKAIYNDRKAKDK